jgi:hypothetical protein
VAESPPLARPASAWRAERPRLQQQSRTFSHRLRGLKALSVTVRRGPAARLTAPTGARRIAARRLRATLESLVERGHEGPDRILTNLPTEHRRYALEALAHLRKR